MQFLKWLNDKYESLRNQILVLDPLPSVYKAYSMALSVEKQIEVHINFSFPIEASAMPVRNTGQGYNGQNDKKNFPHKGKPDFKNKNVGDRYCNFCKVNGHTREVCFKLNGYPDWFKDLKEKKKRNYNATHMANVNHQDNDNPLQEIKM